jgi:hypothetical protein
MGDEWWIVMIAMRTILEEMTPVGYAHPVLTLAPSFPR